MRLLIILLCMGFERFLPVGAFLKRFNWLPWYVEKLQKSLANTPLWRGVIAPITVVLPILLAVGIAYYGLGYGSLLAGFLKFLIGVFVLFYCIGPEDFFQAAAKNENNATEVPIVIFEQDIFWQAHERLFAVLFWYVVLGPLAAVLYRVISLLARNKTGQYGQLSDDASVIHGILAWLPVRLIGLGYALVGNFMKTFGFWLDNLVSHWRGNHELVDQFGRIAQGLEPNTQLTTETAQASASLIERMLIVFIVAVALFTLGAWM